MDKMTLVLWRCPITHAHDVVTAHELLAGNGSLFCTCGDPLLPLEEFRAA